jgi:hypothetical protein
MLGEGEWKTKKHGADYRRQWRKVHLGIDAKMRCLKLLGERIMPRDFDRQVAELQVRAALLNRFTQLRTPVTVSTP